MGQVGIKGPGQSMRVPLFVQAWIFSPADLATMYCGAQPIIMGGVANLRKIYVPAAGRIIGAMIFTHSATAAGTNENWSLYIRKNDTTDYLIAMVGLAAAERNFNNMAMDIPMIAGDYFEIKMVCPTWVTNPTGTTLSGNVYFEV
jgi:hypothetical protein